MKAIRLLLALLALTSAGACSGDSISGPEAPSAASHNTGMGSPGYCGKPTC